MHKQCMFCCWYSNFWLISIRLFFIFYHDVDSKGVTALHYLGKHPYMRKKHHLFRFAVLKGTSCVHDVEAFKKKMFTHNYCTEKCSKSNDQQEILKQACT